jgi:hypothetical protein
MLSEQDKRMAAAECLPEGPSSRPEAPSSRRVLIGFNHNVPYGGHIFHVQTEDLGRRYAYATSHVFNDRGRVVKTRRTAYTELLSDPEAKAKIRNLVRDQHQLVVEEVAQGIFEDQLPSSSLLRAAGLPDPLHRYMPPSGVRPVDKPDRTAEPTEPPGQGVPPVLRRA